MLKNIMSTFGFRQQNKITPDNGSTGGNGNGNNNGNGQGSGQNQTNQEDDEQEDSLFGSFVDGDEADSDFDLGDSFFKSGNDDGQGDDDQNQLTEDQQKIMNEVSEAMKADIGRALMADSDFQDFDVNDQQKFRAMIDKSMQRGAAAAVTAMMHPMTRAIEDAISTLRKEFQAGFETNKVKSKAEQAFEPISKSLADGIKDKNLVAFAKNNFQMVLQKTKNVQKAQEATIQLLKTMGFAVSRDGRPARQVSQFGNGGFEDFSGGTGGNQGGNRGIKTGNDALDSFFPPSR